MRKFSLFMLMAVGLLISASMSAMPERPTPPTPKTSEGVEMVKPQALAKAPSKAPMGDETAAAKIGMETYTTLEEALEKAKPGETVTLLKDVTTQEGYVIDKNITLDLGGKTITNNNDNSESTDNLYVILTKADVTITNGSLYVTKEESESDYSCGVYVSSKTTTLDNVTIGNGTSGTGYAAYVGGGKNTKLVVKSGTLLGLQYGVYIYGESKYSCLEQEGGTISGGKTGVCVSYCAKYLLNDGVVNSISSEYWYNEIEIHGGTVNGKISVDYASYSNLTTLTIYGGIINAEFNLNNAITHLYGGTYNKDYSNIVEEGYKVVKIDDDIYTIIKDEPLVARIGDKKYYSVADAVNEAGEGKDVIYLLRDIAGDVEISKNITLNIASHNIEGTLIATSGKTVMVDGKGTITALSGTVKIIRAFTKFDPTGNLADGSKFEKKSDNLYRVYPEKVAKMEVGGKETFYETVVAAFAALPENSTPATITLLADEYMEYVGKANTVAQYHNTTLDLNGHVIYGTTDYPTSSSAVIINNGTLIVKDGSQSQTGAIYNSHTNPEDWASLGKTYPSYSYSTFMNNSTGTLIIESGYFNNVIYPSEEARNKGLACYVIDNYNGKVIINGGTLYNQNTYAIRMWCTSTQNEVTINGGTVFGPTGAIQLHLPSDNGTPCANLTINGGIVDSNSSIAIALYSHGYQTTNISITINEGATINGNLDLYNAKQVRKEAEGQGMQLNITGGQFNIDYYGIFSDNIDEARYCVTGGTFYSYDKNAGYTDGLIHYDYFAKYVPSDYCITDWQDDNGVWWKTVKACNQVVIDENKTITNPEEIKPSDILIVTGNEDDKNPVTVTIGSDAEHPIEVNVNTITGDGEAQIVVKDGATLNVGNGGLVSENNELVFVKVEAGGKMTIGNKGLDQKGEIFPIIVENNTEKSGVYMVSPDAQSPADETQYDITKPEATVRVYTRAYMTKTSEHWQHFACPVQTGVGLDGVPTQVKMVPMNVNPDDPVLTVINEWDYNTDKWKIMPVNGGAEYFGNDGWTTDITMKPFYAYNLLNNSRPTDEGITYEFHGNLVGNEDMKLFFPEHGFCFFGNSYTAPIDLSALFAKVKSDIKTGNIDLCVYIYNSQDDRFENVNEEQLALEEEYGIKAPFKQIPPQQAFIMNLTTGNTGETSVDYRKAVWGNKQSNLNVPIRAPKAMGNDYTNIVRVAVADAMSADNVTLVEGYNFDETYNYGSDAYKYMDNKNFNLYASTEAGQLAMVADNSIEGTILTLQAGKAMEYTLTFPNVLGTDYQLIDLLTGTAIQMVEGNEYTFTAQPNSVVDRFMVVAINKAPTSMDKIQNTKEAKGVYSILGQSYGEKLNVNALPQGVYIINGVKVVK